MIELANRDPRRGDCHEKPLTRITADPIVLAILRKNGRALDEVPAEGEMVMLSESANLSTGGSARDVTDEVHPTIRRICERAARTIGLDVCEIDLVVPDIRAPFASGGIVEVNASPGIRMHHFPSEGQARDVASAMVDMLYPAGQPSRIPIISITVTNGKITVTRMVGHILATRGQTVGLTTTDGIWIGGEEVACGDMTRPWSAGVVLSDCSVDAAVLETARGGVVRSGLGYDWSDISVMTNIHPDHIGQDGIESIEDILRIKRLVAERTREGGTLILNADDEQLVQLPAHERVAAIPKTIVYFSLHPANPVVQRHLLAGGKAYVVAGNVIEERDLSDVSTIAAVEEIPATLDGTAEFQIYNVLAAIAAARAHGVSIDNVRAALADFRMDRHGSGRVNVFDFRDGYVIVDYGHNPLALKSMQDTIARWTASRRTAVIGIPGDRRDDLITASARVIANGFDRIFIREDKDLRGRKLGELSALLAQNVRDERSDVEMRVILDELDATAAAACSIVSGEIVVLFSDRKDEVIAWIRQAGAEPLFGR